jgi:hypothetical protein
MGQKMKYLLILLLALGTLQADKVIKRTLACPSVVILEKAPLDTKDNYMDLNMYAMMNGCVFLNKGSSIEAIGYNANNSKEIYQEIIYQKTGVHLFVKRSAIIVEKFGRKSSFRF